MKDHKTTCPYEDCADTSYWRRSVAQVPPAEVDPVIATKFSISRQDKVATAGSCFAQHISRFLAGNGFNYFIAEPGSALLDVTLKKQYNYGTFSCRYGNVYTARQLLQLVQRALGKFTPGEKPWIESGAMIDPLRPQIQPGGFATMAEYHADRAAHLRAVKKMLLEMDVFIFTLGLTEAWEATTDGTAFPICPGCSAGTFDSQQYRFVNFSVTDVISDLQSVATLMREINPTLRIILTVSPVPLVATYEKQHVLQATTYSKSVLRVAAEALTKTNSFIDYFPSYEIITGSYSRGAYFGSDLREVRDEGVAHVMRLFSRHYLNQSETSAEVPPGKGAAIEASSMADNRLAATLVCDEEALDKQD